MITSLIVLSMLEGHPLISLQYRAAVVQDLQLKLYTSRNIKLVRGNQLFPPNEATFGGKPYPPPCRSKQTTEAVCACYLVCQALHKRGLAGAGFSHQEGGLLVLQGHSHPLHQAHGMPRLSKAAPRALHATHKLPQSEPQGWPDTPQAAVPRLSEPHGSLRTPHAPRETICMVSCCVLALLCQS